MWISTAALQMAITVGLGAFGAHSLQQHISPEQLAIWHTATLYAFIHLMGILCVAIYARLSNRSFQTICVLLQLGVLLFCGSLYALALGAPKSIGWITPLGGLCFIMGWLTLAWTSLKDTHRFNP